MKILDRYIAVLLLQTSGLALLVLLALFAVLSLIDQLGDAGHGNYTVIKIIEYVALTLPRLALVLTPVAVVIGAMTTLGILAHNSELVIIHAAGVSRSRLALSLMKGGMLIVLMAVLVGEFLVPYCEHAAQQMRSVALSKQIAISAGKGFWSRDSSSYINIRKILPNNQLEEIYIYEFDNEDRLRTSTYAKRGKYVNGQWVLEDIEQSVIDNQNDKVVRNNLKLAAWGSLLNPTVINLVMIKPDYLSLWELLDYIAYLQQNAQNSQRYELALWSKLTNPFTILALIVLAVPLVRSGKRTVAVGQRVFMGCLAGLVFHVVNQIAGQMSLVYSINAAVSASLPTLIVASLTYWLMRREA